jgi:transposase
LQRVSRRRWSLGSASCAPVGRRPSAAGSIASKRAASPPWTSSRAAGASPLFPPQVETPEAAKEAFLHVVRRDPRLFGIDGTRWTLDAIKQVCDWLRSISIPGLSQLLERLEISWKRAREHIHSPDPDYQGKLAYVKDVAEQVRKSAGRVALVYLDELTFYRQPTLANAWEERGHHQVLAERSYRSNTPTRLVGTLDLLDGRVLYRRRWRITVAELVGFYQDLSRRYAGTQRIYAVQDNWPVHFHPDVLVALQKQESPWKVYRPPDWPDKPSAAAKAKYGSLELPIQLVPLPTYASWTNPIEKLWRKLRQELLHLHRMADSLDDLRGEVDRFLDKFAEGSLELLRYVGLLKPG